MFAKAKEIKHLKNWFVGLAAQAMEDSAYRTKSGPSGAAKAQNPLQQPERAKESKQPALHPCHLLSKETRDQSTCRTPEEHLFD